MSVNCWEFEEVIGSGGFSNVLLARLKKTGKLFAIKIIDKEDMLRRDKEETVFNERNILTRLSNPFIAELKYAFQTVICF